MKHCYMAMQLTQQALYLGQADLATPPRSSSMK